MFTMISSDERAIAFNPLPFEQKERAIARETQTFDLYQKLRSLAAEGKTDVIEVIDRLVTDSDSTFG